MGAGQWCYKKDLQLRGAGRGKCPGPPGQSIPPLCTAGNTIHLCVALEEGTCSLSTRAEDFSVFCCHQEQVHLKIACPGVVRTLATTPDGVYCAGGIAEKIYVWQVCCVCVCVCVYSALHRV